MSNKYLYINGQKIQVSDDVFSAYVNPINAERKRKKRQNRCRVEKGKICTNKCDECQYYLSGENPTGKLVSIDKLKEESGFEVLDDSPASEIVVENKIIIREMNKLIENLDYESRMICEYIKSGYSERQMAHKLGIPQTTLHYRKAKVLRYLKNALKNN